MSVKTSFTGTMNFPIVDIKICPGNCSYHGDCLGGKCLCEVRFTGWACDQQNLAYFISFGVFFYIVCLMTICQLILCIRAEYNKLKKPSILMACKLDVQKSVYLAVIFASGSRAAYFIFQSIDLIPVAWKENLFSTFYPFVMSAFALIICFWAESFHLSDVHTERSKQFLTKSFGGYVAFNVIVYVMWIAQITLSHLLPSYDLMELNEIFNGGFAFLMFTVLVFFLIYGVEIFCKVEGAFRPDSAQRKNLLNLHQLFQSRLGLVAQAAFQLAVTMFLMTEVLRKLWKRKMSIGERNLIDISFHMAELACALWFPCCFWNATQPSELWILNPKKLLMLGRMRGERESLVQSDATDEQPCYSTFEQETAVQKQISTESLKQEGGECWICYDGDKEGELIQPCDCKGGMRLVHHECLKTWLLERPSSTSSSKDSSIRCSVCKAKYNVTNDTSYFCHPNLLQFRAWAQTFFIVATMAALPVSIYFAWNKITQGIIRMVVIVLLLLAEYFFLRLLGFNFLQAYKITMTRAMKILGRKQEELVSREREVDRSDDIAVIVTT